MGYKRIIRKIAKFILASQPDAFVQVNVGQIQSGSILKDKKIVITGGGSGLGFAMAKKFISEGAQIVISGRNADKLNAAVEKLGNSNCKTVVADVCDVSHSKEFLGKAFLEMKTKEEQPNAELLYITSETGDQVYDIPYGMTNAALNSMVGAFSRRVYQRGIRVNAIAPGVTLTEMTRDYAESSDGNLYRNCASGRTFLPEEVAEVACFFLSDASKCISGEVIHCNAGNHLKAFWDESK